MYIIRGVLSGVAEPGAEIFFWNDKWTRSVNSIKLYATKECAIKDVPIAEDTSVVMFILDKVRSVILSTVEVVKYVCK